MKNLTSAVFLSMILVGCGSSGSSDSSGETETNDTNETNTEQNDSSSACTVSNDTLLVQNGTSCTISDSVSSTYRLSSLGVSSVECNANGEMTAGAFRSLSGNVTLNGLSMRCTD